ncbi:hypothetical protein ACLQ2P_26385 [Actinomadura citrea]
MLNDFAEDLATASTRLVTSLRALLTRTPSLERVLEARLDHPAVRVY